MSLFPTPKDLTKKELKEFVGHKDEVNCVSYSSDFLFMVTGSDDQRVRIFNVKTKQCIIKLKGHEGAIKGVAVSPCDRYIASCSFDKTARIWRTANGSEIHVLKGHEKSVEVVTFSPGSLYLCTGSWDRTARIWSVEATGSWDYSVRVWRLRKNDLEGKTVIDSTVSSSTETECVHKKSIEIKENPEQCGSVSSSAILTDSDNNASNEKIFGCDAHIDGEKKIENENATEKENKENLQTMNCDNSNKPTEREISKEDKREKEHEHIENSKEEVDQKDIPEVNKDVKILDGHTGNVRAVCFSRIGMLASGSWDKTIRLWNPRNGRCLRLLMGHQGWVQALSFSYDATFIASAADDDSVKVWDIPSGTCINTLEGNTDLAQHCAFTLEGQLICSGAAVSNTKKLKTEKKEDEEQILDVMNQGE